MKYYGDGLSIKVIDKNGNTVDTRNVPYSALQSYSDSSWTYKIPEGDSQPYMYEITYYTVVDMEKVEGTGNRQERGKLYHRGSELEDHARCAGKRIDTGGRDGQCTLSRRNESL